MPTETSGFGSGKRESHDATAYYNRRMTSHDTGEVGEPVEPPIQILDQLYCQSSESMDQLPDNCVSLMVTSPPYNVGKEYDEDLAIDEYLALLKRVFAETYRVLEPGGRIAVNVANLGRKPYVPLNHYVAGLLGDLGYMLRGEVIWQKAKGAGGSCAWGSWKSAVNPTLRDVHEYIIVGSKESFGRVRRGEITIERDAFREAPTSILSVATAAANPIRHPAPFPVELPRRLIELYTFTGDLVLDPFIGSGTTALAAREAGRHYVGYDTSQEYIELAAERLAELK